MRIPLAFELNHNETLQLVALTNDFENGILDLLEKNSTTDDGFDRITATFKEKSSAIRNEARKRSLVYFSSHHEELLTALKEEIISLCIKRAEREKIEEFIYSPETCKHSITTLLSPYLEILNDNESQDIMSFIDDSIRNREQFFRDKEERDTMTYESAKAKRVKKIIAPVDKITQSIFNPSKNPALYGGGADLIVGQGKIEVTTAVSLRFEELGEVKTSTRLDENHRAIYNAVISQIVTGNTLFTDNMIARTITGKDIFEEKIKHTISEGMDTLIRTRASIDATQEAKAFKLKGLENVKYEGALLDVRRITATINGKTLECYKIIAEPWLLTYAKAKNQLDTYDVRLLNSPFQAISATTENISLVSHLLNHIMAILNPNSRIMNTILYETLYHIAGIDAPTEATAETKRRRLRDKVHKILDVWTNEGLINGYEDLDEDGKPAKNGKKIAKIKISCSIKKRRLPARKH